ncbi:hypothetical protein, partial [Klebsiella pneumoniae]|uniref:hypothetical protein n=1 Tax=Klebsiella pneumoniae TaxID=573 RepID=UPI001E29C101
AREQVFDGNRTVAKTLTGAGSDRYVGDSMKLENGSSGQTLIGSPFRLKPLGVPESLNMFPALNWL